MSLNQEEAIDSTKNNYNTSDLKSVDDQAFINLPTLAISKENVPTLKDINFRLWRE
ncbi:MAG: hypothetical protein ACE5SW_12840 [Nitrososphaeraceae archaeon]